MGQISQKENQLLLHADSLMAEYPDRALYALLLTQARYKNYDYLLGPAFIIYNGMDVPNRAWSVTLNGTITHWMVGYPETKWVDTW